MTESPGCCSIWARCLQCLYSCHWRKYPKQRMQTSKCDCIWFGLLFLTFLLSLGWLYIGLILLNDLHNFNEFLFRHWGHWMDWSLVLLLVISLLVTYASLLLLLGLLLQLCGHPLHLHSLHKVLLLVVVLLVAAGLVGLDIQWRQEWYSLRLSLQATAPFLHIGAVAGVTFLAWPVADTFYRIHPRGPKALLLFLFFGVTLVIYLAPIFISSPCIMELRDLPPKPGLVGHRGAPMLAPENTLMSLRKTAECGAAVFETDVMVSSDGVPFLMHDERLSRTTDVASVFPERMSAHSSDFSWAELQRLNAGAWFLERQPFWGAKELSGPDRQEAENQTVPALEELLKEAAALNLSIMFDLRRPPRNHTYYETFVNQTLEAVLNASVPQAMVMLSRAPKVPLLPPFPTYLPSAMMVSRLPPALTLLPQITYSILWPNISVPVPGIPRTCSVVDSSSLNHRFFGCRMKIVLMCGNGRPECARSTAIRVVTGQRGSSFSTYPIKTCQRWISTPSNLLNDMDHHQLCLHSTAFMYLPPPREMC
ncbi:glycerophosphoinositol inositolphosphodiesterase GDPD2 isoform X2 [Peromyscus leucopus]|uniref:glycerophosphoinositol inositolphosphodiesterase GDPD2 isoform X2 n=1 Tax=Peromyscus leucopus TaxID=10041 RepID=UPI001884DB3F|nr:glycerophosphoinositol inositolphosphodiesterase GDPD2 isoform X2 [Peromyscus leucopus]